MNIAAIRGYLRETIEFFVYFVFMTGIGAAMYVLVNYAPQANSGWYINTCIGMAVFTGIYAVRMFRRYRRAMRRLALFPDELVVELAQMSEEERRTMRWSERIAAERLEARGGDAERVRLLERLEALERAYRERCAVLGVDPDKEGGEFTIDPNMSVEAIRDRIADRVLRQDEDEEEDERPPIFRS
ncbi:hypothetical protein SAMN03159338_3450 [Sphingomonas sp. NFR04]|uniref:hypothetical protein n=1 Tax=Sphingomonas sp. NFR04 TaxID=1566283 RepID=UPI0008EF4ACB|nr:hypothetical protein [Sphingomonas sp. NFR04]SFK16167.1 hypothetical protein SAMN03159338_3450 [Sphingomonas sp. NFR04]